ncbi:MAG: WD40 repeat domain-containing protein, partial [Synechococcales bacterium]|nr:WD40 repeat domain-containing protein [Synechococcales bacterium]
LGVMVFLRSSEINQVRDLQGSAAGRLLLDQNLEALVESIKAGKALKHPLLRLFAPPDILQNEVQATLQNAMSQARERNRLVADGDIRHITFSPDGQIIATAHGDNTVSFWDTSGQRLTGLNTLEVDTIIGPIWNFSFTPDGEQLVMEVYDEARQGRIAKRWNIWGEVQLEEAPDLESFGINAAERTTLDNNEYVAISPDGTYRASASARTLSVYGYNPNNGNYQWVASGQGANFFNSNTEAFNVRFSPDSQRIVTANSVDGIVYLWDLGGNQLAQFRHTGGVLDLAFSPDGQQLATVGQDGTVRVWQNLEGNQLQEFRGYSGQDAATGIRISSSGQQFAVATASGTVQVWNLASQERTAVLPPSNQAIAELRFSPDDRFLALGNSEDGKVWVWNLETLLLTPEMKGFGSTDLGTFQRDVYGGGAWSGSFSPDNQWLALGGNDIVLHNIIQPEQQVSLPIERIEGNIGSGWRQGLTFDETGQLLAAGGFDGQLELWDWQQQSKVDEIEAGMTPRYVTFSPNGDLVAMSGVDNGIVVVRLWNREKQQQQAELRGHTQVINSVVFSPDGNQLATASRDGTARVWNLQGQQLAVFKGHDEVKHVAFSADGQQLITAGFSHNIVNPELRTDLRPDELWQVKVWEVQTLDELLAEGCAWIRGYLNHSQDLESEPEFRGDRPLCDDLASNATAKVSSQIINLTPVEPASTTTN